MSTIEPGDEWSEGFRVTCPRVNETLEYCPDEDKVTAQGVSIKISKNESIDGDITQFEYFLAQNPGDSFRKLYYDIALIDCATNRSIKDVEATDQDHDAKKKCPGYEGGIGITFNNDTETKKCPPVYCNGEQKCLSNYTFEWTQRQEANKWCEEEYYGDLHVTLCVNKDPAVAKYVVLSIDKT